MKVFRQQERPIDHQPRPVQNGLRETSFKRRAAALWLAALYGWYLALRAASVEAIGIILWFVDVLW